MNQYEAMFVFDPTFGSELEKCETEIRRLMGRADAEIVVLDRWDERRLAYRIKGRKRGVYVLVYFKAHPERIKGLERDAQLAENILRLLVLRADGVTPEMMNKAASGRGAMAEGEPTDDSKTPVASPDKGKPEPAEKEVAVAEVASQESDTAVADAPTDERASETN